MQKDLNVRFEFKGQAATTKFLNFQSFYGSDVSPSPFPTTTPFLWGNWYMTVTACLLQMTAAGLG